MVEINVSIKGGASLILGYFSFCQEVYEKNIHIDNFAGASGGSLISGLLAQGYSPEDIRDFFIGIPGDETMIVAQNIQTGVYPPIELPLRFLQVYFDVVFKEFSQLRSYLKRHYSWTKCSSKCYFATFDVSHAIRDSKTVAFLETNPEKSYQAMKPYYFSNDGVYTVNVLSKDSHLASFKKVSDYVVPMDLAVYSSFCMPFFPINFIRIPHLGIHQFWDGGFVNNHGHLPFVGKDFIQLEVDSPKTLGALDERLDKFNNFWLRFNTPVNVHKFYTKTDPTKLGFFSFQAEIVQYEFNNRRASNVFG